MGIIGVIVIWGVMACAVAGAIASMRDDEKGLGKEFLEGLCAIGSIFIPVAGIMASVPYLEAFIRFALGPAFAFIGADPAMAATTVIAVDMGGYQLAGSLAQTPESWIMAMMAGYMAGATIVFSIPVGLALLDRRDHKYLALGMMSGLLSIPIGILISSLLLVVIGPAVKPLAGGELQELHLTIPVILRNLVPLVIVVTLLAVGLRLFPKTLVRGFMGFGRGMDILIKLVLVAVIVQHFTGVFTLVFGVWGFNPVVANFDQVRDRLEAAVPIMSKADIPLRDEDLTRALEVAGYIGLMLSGAFPMVYLIKKYLAGPMETVGGWLGLGSAGAAGLLAAAANILAMFRLVKDMRAKDKVLVIAFAVCSAFLIGDHLAFTANFQPNVLLPVLLGKFGGGICGFLIASRLSVPRAVELEAQDEEAEVRALLVHVPLLRDQELVITPLLGGLTNRNYRIDAGGEALVLRIARADAELLGIDRDREAGCTRAAAAAGAAPDVVTYLPEQLTLIRRFAPGRSLTAEDLRLPETLRRVAGVLRRCHDQPAPAEAAAFSPFGTVRRYLELARERQVPLPAELDRGLELLERIEKELPSDGPPTLCHNDLLPANLIDDGTSVAIIDWEYAGCGDRFFDLGNLAANAQFDSVQEQQLLETYLGAARPEDLRRLHLMRLASELREALWGFLQSSISRLHPPRYYLEYGRKHLGRFLAEADRIRPSEL